MGKIRVEELAAQMGIGSKEVLFLLQSIGVDVKSPQAALDESTVLAILQGKTHAPKQLIVRDSESKAFRPQKSALSRIKIVEKTAPARPELEAEPVLPRGLRREDLSARAARRQWPAPAPGRVLPPCVRRVRRDRWGPLREARGGRLLRSIARLPAARGCGRPAHRCARPDSPGVPDRARDRAWAPL